MYTTRMGKGRVGGELSTYDRQNPADHFSSTAHIKAVSMPCVCYAPELCRKAWPLHFVFKHAAMLLTQRKQSKQQRSTELRSHL